MAPDRRKREAQLDTWDSRPIAFEARERTIHDRLQQHVRRLAWLPAALLALAGVAAWYDQINVREHRVTAGGWAIIALGAFASVLWARALPFPCPQCGRDLVPLGRRKLPRVCPSCGLSLDRPSAAG